MKILITGTSGLLGSNFYFTKDIFQNHEVYYSSRQKIENHDDIYVLDPLNIKQSELKDVNFDLIIHCGSATHVDKCEQDHKWSQENICLSTRNLVDHYKKSIFYYISTDYVFDGSCGPYLESAQPSSLNVYGSHKLVSEIYVHGSNKKNKVIRLSNLYGREHFRESEPKNFIDRSILSIQNGQTEFKQSYENYTTFTLASDVVKAISMIVDSNITERIVHLASTDYLNKVQILYLLAKHLKKEINVTQLTNSEILKLYPGTAIRPKKAGLISAVFNKYFPDFLFTSLYQKFD